MQKDYNKDYREKNREVLREKDRLRYASLTEEQRQIRLENAKKSYQKHKNKILIKMRERHLDKTYNLSGKEYLNKMIEQENKCAICNQYEKRYTKTGDVKPLSVDHNHTTGEIRGLLCNDCNALLGFAHEDTEILLNALTYLQSYK